MIGTRHVVAFLVVNLAAGIPLALAREAEEPAPEKVGIRTAVEKIAKEGKVNILLDEGVEGEVAPPDGSLPWKEQLRAVEVEAGVEVLPLGEETFVVRPRHPVTLEFDNLPVSQALRDLSRAADVNIVAPHIPGRKVSVEVEGAPLREVLEDVARQSGLAMIRDPGSVIRFSMPEEEERLARRPLSEEALAALGLARSKAEGKGRISIEATDEKAGDLVDRISESVGIPIRLGGPNGDPDWMERKVTLKLVDAPWDEAVRAIAWRIGGHAWDDGKGGVSIRRPSRTTLNLEDTPLDAALGLLSDVTGIAIEAGEGPDIQIDMQVSNLPSRYVIYALSRIAPFDLEVKPDGTLVAKPY